MDAAVHIAIEVAKAIIEREIKLSEERKKRQEREKNEKRNER